MLYVANLFFQGSTGETLVFTESLTGAIVLGRSRVHITARRALLKMKTRNNTVVINTISRKEHLVLENVCDRQRFEQLTKEASVVDAMLGAMARCPGNSSGKKVYEATQIGTFEGMSEHGTVLVLNFFYREFQEVGNQRRLQHQQQWQMLQLRSLTP